MNSYRRFTTLADANDYCDAQTVLMALPADQVTVRWADPVELTDGSFVVRVYQDDTAISWQDNWVVAGTANDG